MNTEYNFNAYTCYLSIEEQWKEWAIDTFGKDKASKLKWVIGISGGKDSTVVAALACKIFGENNVVGVSMPCDGQKDMDDVDLVFKTLNMQRVTIDIDDAFASICDGVENNAIDVSSDTKINLPARLRMATLYAVAQSVNGVVLNTCNLSEDICGYATLYGDNAGSYSPVQALTVTEILALGDWLDIPYKLVHKTPIDGLQPLSDEDKLGFKYADLDKFIRLNEGSVEFKQMIHSKYKANKFKTDIVNIPHPVFRYSNFVYLYS